MLHPFADEIWIADGSKLSVLGFEYPTRCAVIRLAGGVLFVWSPVTLTQALKAEVDALGTVTHLVAPNNLHHMFLSEWQSAYPDAQLFALPVLTRKRPDLRIDAFLTNTPDARWAQDIDQSILPNRLTDEVVFFHHPSGTVIFTDLIQQFPPDHHKGWRRLVARLDLMVGDTPNVPRKFRMGFGNKAKTRESLTEILDWPIERVLMAHGAPVTADGKAVLRETFRWLIK